MPRSAFVVLAVLALALPVTAWAQSSGIRTQDAPVQPGDRIFVKFSRDPQWNDTVLVDASRVGVFPRLGMVDVSALTLGTVRDSLRARYGRYLRDPALDVLVLRRIIVNGDVGKPNVYLVDATATLQEVIARAGGVTELGDARKVQVIRDGQPRLIPDWERDRTVASELRSGDQVFVGRRSWLSRNSLQAFGALAGIVSIVLALRGA